MSATTPTPTRPIRAYDGRGSWWPTRYLIRAKFLELRRRRGLMVALGVVTIGIPSLYFAVRLIEHAISPSKFGAAGGYSQFLGVVTTVLYVLGFIMAATVGATAGTSDLSDGMFRHLVVTGRSRLAIYFARIPATLMIVVPMVTAGFIVVSAVSSLAAPNGINVNGATVPYGLTASQLETWGGQHAKLVLCNFPQSGTQHLLVPCGPGNVQRKAVVIVNGQPSPTTVTPAQLSAAARRIAASDYSIYRAVYQRPPWSLVFEAWGWILLEVLIGAVVGIGLSSLLGQRTLAVVLLLLLEIVLTPIASHNIIPYMLNVQRGIVGVAMNHLAPHQLLNPVAGGQPLNSVVPESRGLAWIVVGAWLVVWSILGAWRMARRDA